MNALFEQVCLPMWHDQSLEGAEERAVAAGYARVVKRLGGFKAPSGTFPKGKTFFNDDADLAIKIGTGTVSGKTAFGAKGGHVCAVEYGSKNTRVSGTLLPLQEERDISLNSYRISTSSPWRRKSGPQGGTFGTGTTPPSIYLIKHF